MRKAFLFAFLVAAASTTFAHACSGVLDGTSQASIACSAHRDASNGVIGSAR